MCIKSRLQQHIRNLTKDGELVARFLVDTVEGRHKDARYHHKLEAAKLLERYSSSDEDAPHFWGLMPTPEEIAEKNRNEEPKPEPRERKVTYLDILNYDIAHLIRTETADGHTIAEFLSHVMTRQDKPFTPKKLRIRHIDRMTAAMEILRRGHGHFGRKRKLVVDDYGDTSDYDTLHTDLAKRMREYSEHGTDAVRFLLDVMEDADPDEPYTWRHRVSAAQELLRRGWDTNYDKITPEMLQDYWRDQQSSRLSVGQKKRLAGLPVEVNDYDQYDNTDYQALAQELREQEDLEAISPVAGSKFLPPIKPPLHQGEGETNPTQTAPSTDDTPDCYHEPLNPEQQAIFDYQTQIESGEYEQGEITLRQTTPEDRKSFEAALASLKELAAAEGVPLLPNPLAGTLKRPNIRSP